MTEPAGDGPSMFSGYPARHFSLANPKGPESEDIPRLLRRLADELESVGVRSDDILDITLGWNEMTEHGARWSATVYWSPDEP